MWTHSRSKVIPFGGKVEVLVQSSFLFGNPFFVVSISSVVVRELVKIGAPHSQTNVAKFG